LNPAQFDVPNADWSCAPAGICSPESGTGNIACLPAAASLSPSPCRCCPKPSPASRTPSR
jgi:hypothetical protein